MFRKINLAARNNAVLLHCSRVGTLEQPDTTLRYCDSGNYYTLMYYNTECMHRLKREEGEGLETYIEFAAWHKKAFDVDPCYQP